MPAFFDKMLRAGEGKILRKLTAIAGQVNAIEDDFAAMTDAQLRAMTDEFRTRLEDGQSLDDLLPEAFATVREAAKRTLGQRHFDVQMMGGAALHLGNIAEMKTGEGKTLVATAPAYLNALSGKGVHVVTVNDYLAEYQSELMGRVHRFLGLEVGVILSKMKAEERREQYAADITYGTNNEFGFDYLRDNMAWSRDELVQRGHNYAIVDEVDSILIDEARTPLIISGPADQPTKWYADFAGIVNKLSRDVDYEVDEKKRTVGILERGVARVEDFLGIENLYESANTPLVGYLNNAIRAKELYKNDKDYVVMNGEVLIVDEHTGRMLAGRRYNEGMHQAIEAKEGVEIKQENQTLATITLQNFFRLYDKLSGMTGTATTEASEFSQIYKLGVVPIPTNMPMIRDDQADLVYKTEDAKFKAVVDDIVDRHTAGQPVLVGTVSVQKSELLSGLLKKRGVKHEVLNAKQHEREATHRRRGRPQGRRHGRHQHGRPRHRHHARRQRRVPRRPRAARPRPRPGRDPGGLREGLARGRRAGQGPGRGRARRGPRARRAVRARHRAPRVAADRQPAARTLRPPGRPGQVPLLPLARRRPDAAVQRRHGRVVPHPVQHPRGRPDRVEDGHQRHPLGADPGRGAELRDPQERPQVRRGAQPAAHRHLRRAPPASSRAPTCTSRSGT